MELKLRPASPKIVEKALRAADKLDAAFVAYNKAKACRERTESCVIQSRDVIEHSRACIAQSKAMLKKL